MLSEPQVLKVPPTNPLAWQTSLIDSEVDSILDGGIFGPNKEGRHGSVHGGERTADNGMPPSGQRRDFLRRGAGRTSAGGTSSLKETGDDGVGGKGTEGSGRRRLDIVPGEVCPVCQEEMEEDGGSEVISRNGPAATAPEGRLTYCRDGCGNNMHARWVDRCFSGGFCARDSEGRQSSLQSATLITPGRGYLAGGQTRFTGNQHG